MRNTSNIQDYRVRHPGTNHQCHPSGEHQQLQAAIEKRKHSIEGQQERDYGNSDCQCIVAAQFGCLGVVGAGK